MEKMEENQIVAAIKYLAAKRSVDNPSLWDEYRRFCHSCGLDPNYTSVKVETLKVYGPDPGQTTTVIRKY